jgi:hypothetical protein
MSDIFLCPIAFGPSASLSNPEILQCAVDRLEQVQTTSVAVVLSRTEPEFAEEFNVDR